MATPKKVEVEIVATDEASPKLDQVGRQMDALEGDVTTVKVDTSGVDELGRSADSSKSVLANMVGNASQDVAGLGGVAGSAGVAIGQMGEYMANARASGEKLGSVLSNFATIAGPIAAIALAVKTFSDVMARFNESQKRTVATQERWTKALMDGGDAAANYAAELADVGKITLDLTRDQSKLENVLGEIDSKWYLKGSLGIFGKLLGDASKETEDLVAAFAKADIQIDEFTAVVEGSEQDQQRFIASLAETTLTADEQAAVIAQLRHEVEDLTAAEEILRNKRIVFPDAATAAPDFGHAPAAGMARIIEANADRRAAVQGTTNVFLPPASPAVTVRQVGDWTVRNSDRSGP